MPAPTLPTITGGTVAFRVASAGGGSLYKDSGGASPCITHGDAATLWKDSSGFGFDCLLQAGGGTIFDPAPDWWGFTTPVPTASFGPRPFSAPGVKFDGASWFFNGAFNRIATTHTPITIAIASTTGDGFQCCIALGDGTTPYMTVIQGGDGAAHETFSAYPGSGNVATDDKTANYGGRSSIWTFDPGASPTTTLRRNLADATIPVHAQGDFGAIPNGLTIGRFNASNGFYFGQVIFEIIVFQGALTHADRVAIEAYFKATYFNVATKHVLELGDSLTAGYPVTEVNDPASWPSGAASWPLILYKSLDPSGTSWTFCNQANVGFTYATVAEDPDSDGSIQTLAAPLPNYFDIWAVCNILICQGGSNDIFGGETDTAIIAHIKEITAPLKAAGYKVILWTICPMTSISDIRETYRLAVNAWIRSTAVSGGWADAVYDPPNLGFSDASDLTLFNADGTHFTEAGNTLHAANLDPIVDGLVSAGGGFLHAGAFSGGFGALNGGLTG